jgi:hypothetical protein
MSEKQADLIAYWERYRTIGRREVIRQAMAVYHAATPAEQGMALPALLAACRDLETRNEEQRTFWAALKAGEPLPELPAELQEIVDRRGTSEERAKAQWARDREVSRRAEEQRRAEGRLNAAERAALEWRERHRDQNGIAAAHANPEPLPEPVRETRAERLANDALRARPTQTVHIDTGRIGSRVDKRARLERKDR